MNQLTWCRRVFVVAALSLPLPLDLLVAQVGTRRLDAVTGDFLVKILDPDGNVVELRVAAGNKVIGTVTSTVALQRDGRWHYRYLLRLAPTSPQALLSFDVPCGRDLLIGEPVATSYSRTEGVSTGIFKHARYAGRSVCEVIGGDLRAGDSLSVQFVADAAPGFGDTHLSGAAAGPVWPGEQRIENATAKLVVDSLMDDVAGWASVLSVAPTRPSNRVASATQALSALSADLGTACGNSALITSAGVCNSLRAKLVEAADAIARGRNNAAAALVRALCHELDAQRGKAVSDVAYINLSALASLVIARLG